MLLWLSMPSTCEFLLEESRTGKAHPPPLNMVDALSKKALEMNFFRLLKNVAQEHKISFLRI